MAIHIEAIVVASVGLDFHAVVLAIAFIAGTPNHGHGEAKSVAVCAWLDIDRIPAVFVGEASVVTHADCLARVLATRIIVVERSIPPSIQLTSDRGVWNRVGVRELGNGRQ